MHAPGLAWALALVVSLPVATAAVPEEWGTDLPLLPWRDVGQALTLATGMGLALAQLALTPPPTSEPGPAVAPGSPATHGDGYAELLRGYRRDPLLLLSLRGEAPDSLLTDVYVDRIGGVRGPHLSRLPTDDVLAASALSTTEGAAIDAQDLWSHEASSSVRQEPAPMQAEDTEAMWRGTP